MTTQFRKWTDLEEKELLKEVSEGLPIYAISRAHDRSKKAIEIRLQDIAIRMIDSGSTYEEAFNKTKMTEEQIKLRLLQIDSEKKEKKQLSKTEQPIRQMVTPDQSLLESIRADIRELKTDLKLLSEFLMAETKPYIVT